MASSGPWSPCGAGSAPMPSPTAAGKRVACLAKTRAAAARASRPRRRRGLSKGIGREYPTTRAWARNDDRVNESDSATAAFAAAVAGQLFDTGASPPGRNAVEAQYLRGMAAYVLARLASP